MTQPQRRRLLRQVLAWLMLGSAARLAAQPVSAPVFSTVVTPPEHRWYAAAAAMRRLAESWGDQAYGAVLVLDQELIGEGPSRVVLRRDASAHAEREAIRDAQRRLKRQRLDGSVLYSTSRPCAMCEAAAAAAGVSRMVFGERLHDAGAPRPAATP